MGEGEGGVDKRETFVVPLPFIPSHRGEGRLSGEYV